MIDQMQSSLFSMAICSYELNQTEVRSVEWMKLIVKEDDHDDDSNDGNDDYIGNDHDDYL